MWCDKCNQALSENEMHMFSGLGFWVKYHPQCCPLEVDGTTCDKPHLYGQPGQGSTAGLGEKHLGQGDGDALHG